MKPKNEVDIRETLKIINAYLLLSPFQKEYIKGFMQGVLKSDPKSRKDDFKDSA